MDEITSAEHARAIRWLQEKLVFIALAVAFISAVVSAVSVTLAIFLAVDVRADVRAQNEQIAVYTIYISKLHADLLAHGFEPPELEDE